MRAREALRRLAVLPLVAYRTLISPFTPASCIYHPTCSAYAQAAILRHGLVAGMLLAGARVVRCVGALYDGGDDPVPDTFSFTVIAEGYRRFHRRRRPGRDKGRRGRMEQDGGASLQ